jgi:hypothetical protein
MAEDLQIAKGSKEEQYQNLLHSDRRTIARRAESNSQFG